MIFSIQRYVEDFLNKRQAYDVDQYAVKVANLYDSQRHALESEEFRFKLKKIRTALFRNNTSINRTAFEKSLLSMLDKKFNKKNRIYSSFIDDVIVETKKIRKKKRNILSLLHMFAKAVESRAIDSFWESRAKNRLKNKPEEIAQGLMATCFKVILNGDGLALREMGSGIGFVDISVVLGKVLHLIEIKILRNHLIGPAQLEAYMKSEDRRTGWLVFFDARPPLKKNDIPKTILVKNGIIKTVVIDINPERPSKKH